MDEQIREEFAPHRLHAQRTLADPVFDHDVVALAAELVQEEGWTDDEALREALRVIRDLEVYALLWDLTASLTCDGGEPVVPAQRDVEPHPAKFAPGAVLATPAALALLEETGHTAIQFLARHLRGEWGDLDATDALANEHALRHGGRLLSAYTLRDGSRLWILTEADRSATTVLLPSDY